MICFSPRVCRKCQTSTLYLRDGFCECSSTPSYSKPTKVSETSLVCQTCYLRGCASCVHGSSYTCNYCKDERAFIVAGQCQCPEG